MTLFSNINLFSKGTTFWFSDGKCLAKLHDLGSHNFHDNFAEKCLANVALFFLYHGSSQRKVLPRCHELPRWFRFTLARHVRGAGGTERAPAGPGSQRAQALCELEFLAPLGR